jgi:hypothetical protein
MIAQPPRHGICQTRRLVTQDPSKLHQIRAKVIGRLAFQNPVPIDYADFREAFGLLELSKSKVWRDWCDDFCQQERLCRTDDPGNACMLFARPRPAAFRA